jgi:transposase
MIAVCRLRYCQRTRAYADKRTAEGKTKTEIIRCLKRYIARELYHALLADLTPASVPHRRPDPTVSITCGAGPIGRTIRTP